MKRLKLLAWHFSEFALGTALAVFGLFLLEVDVHGLKLFAGTFIVITSYDISKKIFNK